HTSRRPHQRRPTRRLQHLPPLAPQQTKLTRLSWLLSAGLWQKASLLDSLVPPDSECLEASNRSTGTIAGLPLSCRQKKGRLPRNGLRHKGRDYVPPAL